MALTNSSITNVERKLSEIEGKINYGDVGQNDSNGITFTYDNGIGLYDCWNTFNYVSKNLKEWADDTIIGLETKEQLIKLSNLLIEVINETLAITKKLQNFCDRQKELNRIESRYQQSTKKATEEYNKAMSKYNS